jgi:hypothetical protein
LFRYALVRDGQEGIFEINGNVTSPQTTPTSTDEKLARRVEFELYSTKAISFEKRSSAFREWRSHSEWNGCLASGKIARGKDSSDG